MAAHEEGEVGFEEGMLWLPSQVLDKAICETKSYSRLHVKHHHYHRDHLDSKSSSMRPKVNVNWSSGGPGMQAIFLDSSQKSCGTGVFLPQRAGTHFHRSKKPACAPVLLPSRVVQALNLNVHALGLQISPRQDNQVLLSFTELNSHAAPCCSISPAMEATLLSSQRFRPKLSPAKYRGAVSGCEIQICCLPIVRNSSYVSLRTNPRNFMLPNRPLLSRVNRRVSTKFSNRILNDYTNVEATPPQSLKVEVNLLSGSDGTEISKQNKVENAKDEQARPMTFRNRFLNFVRLSSVVNNAAESFFKSEIRRRLFVTAVLIVISRVGYFIPLPGFDRRLIPQDYLSFVSGSVDELGDFAAELKMSFFQLGISPQIIASIIMQVLCHVVPSLVKLRKEGLDGHEKIKSYIWWLSFGFAIVEAIILACYSLPYSIYAASYRVKHVMVTSMLLVCGAMTMTWICDTISESGFGQGSSLIICVQILTGYTETLYKMLSQLSGSSVSWGPYLFAVLGVFTIVTMWAVVVTEGCRKIKLQYYGFKLASAARDDSPITEVEPYIPFTINPSGMQPVLTTTYLLAFPSILASILGLPFWEHVKEILNPENTIGAGPWVYYSIYAFFVFLFNIFDIANLPKEIADYLNKMGARIPNIKPGKATIEYLTKIQASTRFWGGLLLSILATTSSIIDHYLRNINAGFAIGLTSVLIIVGSIIELRRSYQAYNVMPSLSKALSRYGV